jgi:hypothetical protein
MTESVHAITRELQDAHASYIQWYRGKRTANSGHGLGQVTEQFSLTMSAAFRPEEMYEVVPEGTDVYNDIVRNLPNWAKDELQDVILYRDRLMALCNDDGGQQYAIIYNDEVHAWPELSDCIASVDAVIDYEIYTGDKNNATT